MKEENLLKISILGSLLGILVLLTISGKIEIKNELISNLDATDIGKSFRISGVITDVKKSKSVTSFQISELNQMKVVVFSDNTTLNKGDYVEVSGKLDEYNGKTNLIADKIVLK